ncbi:MAG TPA: hypothetical protein VF766_07470 [Pyrinomonadaceae bacterium]
MNDRRKLIKASEIGEYVFCARAWRLRLDGYEPTSGHQARRAGTEWHNRHGRALRQARRLKRIAAFSGLLTIVVAVLLLLLWWWR